MKGTCSLSPMSTTRISMICRESMLIAFKILPKPLPLLSSLSITVMAFQRDNTTNLPEIRTCGTITSTFFLDMKVITCTTVLVAARWLLLKNDTSMQKNSNGSLQKETFLIDINVPLPQVACIEALNLSCFAFSLAFLSKQTSPKVMEFRLVSFPYRR